MTSTIDNEQLDDDKLDDYEDMTVKGKSPLYQEVYRMLYAAQTGHVTISIGTKTLMKSIESLIKQKTLELLERLEKQQWHYGGEPGDYAVPVRYIVAERQLLLASQKGEKDE